MRTGASCRGFTLVELLVVIAVIAILAAILFPVFRSAKLKGQQASCAANLKQLNAAIAVYCGDFGSVGQWQYGTRDSEYPFIKPDNLAAGHAGGDARRHAIFGYVRSTGVFKCPAENGAVVIKGNIGHGVVVNGRHQFAWNYTWNDDCPSKPDNVKYISKMPTWVEENTDPQVRNPDGVTLNVVNDTKFMGADVTSGRHCNGCNVAFLDGHVQAMQSGLVQESAKWPETDLLIFREPAADK